MKRIFTISLLLFLTLSTRLFAQFTQADVKFWVGEGPASVVLVVDFRDGTTDPSFAFGYHYSGSEELTFSDLLEAVADAEPKFSLNQSGIGFLEDVFYNTHSGVAGQPDWWSTWSGDNLEDMYMNYGISEPLLDGRWYGVSYGFMGDEGPLKPTVTYPAYNSQWFSSNDVTYWIGAGENQSVIVIDFNAPGEAPVTFAWGIRYNGTITAAEALNLISETDTALDITITDNAITAVTYNGLTANAGADNLWKTFKGTDMSDWVEAQGLTDTLANNQWFGTSFGTVSARRPFIPVAAEANTAGTGSHNKAAFTAYPNPVKNILTIKPEGTIINTEVINNIGQSIKTFKATNQLDLADLAAGVYFIKVYTDKGMFIQKIVKQ